jgi:hypothetical protein
MIPGERICREAVAVLITRLPTSRPVWLRFYDARTEDEEGGFCRLTRVRFILGVERRGCMNCMLEALIHEYAHARAWGATQAGTYDHDAHWGVEYARIYQEFYGVS